MLATTINYKANVLNIMQPSHTSILLKTLQFYKVTVKLMNSYILMLLMVSSSQVVLLLTEMKNGLHGRALLVGQFKVFGHRAVMVQTLIQLIETLLEEFLQLLMILVQSNFLNILVLKKKQVTINT